MNSKKKMLLLFTLAIFVSRVILAAPQIAVPIERLSPTSRPVSLNEIQGTHGGNVLLAGKFQNHSSQAAIVEQRPNSGMSYGGGYQKAAIETVPFTLAALNSDLAADWFIDTLYTYQIPANSTVTKNIKWLCLNLNLDPPPADKSTSSYHFFNTDTTEKYRLVPDVVKGIARFNHFLQDTSDLKSRVWVDKQEDAIYFSGYSDFSTEEWYFINNSYLKPDLAMPHPDDPTVFALDSIYLSVYTANWAIWAVTDNADSIVLREKLTEWRNGIPPSSNDLKMSCHSIYKMLMYAGLPDYAKKFQITPIPANHVEGFEEPGSPPFLWQVSNMASADVQWGKSVGLEVSDGQNTVTLSPHSGEYFSYIPWDGNNDVESWLISPEIYFDNSGIFRVSFWECGIFWSEWGDHHRILYSSGNPDPTEGEFRIISDWVPSNHSLDNNWQFLELNLDSLSGYEKIHLAFQYTGLDADLWIIDDIKFVGTDTGTDLPVVYNKNIPGEYQLSQNYPNPFNASTIINYQIPIQSRVVLKIYNILGQEVIKLVDEVKQPGIYHIRWDGNNRYGEQLGSGIYFCKMIAGKFVQVRRMLVLK